MKTEFIVTEKRWKHHFLIQSQIESLIKTEFVVTDKKWRHDFLHYKTMRKKSVLKGE